MFRWLPKFSDRLGSGLAGDLSINMDRSGTEELCPASTSGKTSDGMLGPGCAAGGCCSSSGAQQWLTARPGCVACM